MLIRTPDTGFIHPLPSEITPQAVYQGRRELLKGLAAGTAGLALSGWAGITDCP